MEILITNGIKVSVETTYHEGYSKPTDTKHVFAYRVAIENVGQDTVQLLRRHWHIIESTGLRREIEGEGVIGQQPVLLPGQKYEYVSWCPIATGLGKMHGTFLMLRHSDKGTFRVNIPEFRLMAPFLAN